MESNLMEEILGIVSKADNKPICNQDQSLLSGDTKNIDSDFTKAGLIIKFHSELLNEDFFLVSNPELRAIVEIENPGIVVYLPQEIKYLTGLEPKHIKKLHHMRKSFSGEFIARNPVSESIFNQQIKTTLTDIAVSARANTGGKPKLYNE